MKTDNLRYIKCLLEQEKERVHKLGGKLKDLNLQIVTDVLNDVNNEIKAHDFR